VSIAGATKCADVVSLIRVSLAHLMQLTVQLTAQVDSGAAFGIAFLWLSATRRELEETAAAATGVTRGQQRGSMFALQLIRQLTDLFSDEVKDEDGSEMRRAGVLIERTAVVDFSEKLGEAFVSLDRVLLQSGAPAAAGDVTRNMVTGWIAGLQQLAAHGGAVDQSVLKVCTALVHG
jgi:hypothetical protein